MNCSFLCKKKIQCLQFLLSYPLIFMEMENLLELKKSAKFKLTLKKEENITMILLSLKYERKVKGKLGKLG